MFVEPGAEERRDFVRQPDRKIEAAGRAGLDRRLDDMLELVVGDLRDDRRDRDVAGHAGVVERLDRREPLARLRCARLERPRDLRIERRHGNRDRGEAQVRGLLEQIEVAQHAVGLGRDREGVARLDAAARPPSG